jgi:glycosyltransferase involved in cell wall biosynthesis
VSSSGRALRVAHVVGSTGFGGAERFVADLARCQAESGEVRATVLACGRTDDGTTVPRYAAEGVTVRWCELRSGFDANPRRLGAITKALSDSDVIHLHGYSPLLALSASQARRPVVFTEHGSLGPGPGSISIAAAKHASKARYLRAEVSTVVCVSQWVATAARRRYRLDSRPLVRVTADGVDLDLLRAHRTRRETLEGEGVDPSAFVVVVAARLAAVKRIDRLLDAVARLGAAGRPWVVLVAGSGPLEVSLKQQCAELGIAGCVRFLGFREHVWEVMSAADVVVLPSDTESFGLVVVEAIALNRPVVAFRGSGGPEEIVEAVGGGCIVGDTTALTAILELFRRGDTPPDWRAPDTGRLRERYDIRKVTSEYLDVYREVLG